MRCASCQELRMKERLADTDIGDMCCVIGSRRNSNRPGTRKEGFKRGKGIEKRRRIGKAATEDPM